MNKKNNLKILKFPNNVNQMERQVEAILFAAEEQGLWGAKAYVKAHKNALNNIVAAAESDFGADKVYAIESRVTSTSLPTVRAIAKHLKSLGIRYSPKNDAFGGPDLIPFKESKVVPIFSLHQDGTDYFDYHHTADDTLDKIDPKKLNQNVAAYAVFALLAAQSTEKLIGK